MSDTLHDMDTLQYVSATHRDKSLRNQSEISLIPALIIQNHADLERIGDICWMNDLLDNQVLQLARNQPDFCKHQSLIGTPLADPYISRSPIQLTLLADNDIKIDTVDSKTPLSINGTPINGTKVVEQDQLLTGTVIELGKRITLLLKLLPYPPTKTEHSYGMIGISPKLQIVRQKLNHLKNLDGSVLIRGATGVGKELVAKAVYDLSSRTDKPFVKVNLGAIPPSLATSELFGVQKGAFTGAEKSRKGYFAEANGGTLFLDEIGEATLEVQSLLLRVLESGEFYPVGSSKPSKVDVRLIAATDVNLNELCQANKFKAPLLHRLENYEINVPSLFERNEDIGLLFLHFAKQQYLTMGHKFPSPNSEQPWITNQVMRKLLSYSWSGNIRQLKNITHQLILENLDSAQLFLTQHLIKKLQPAKNAEESTALKKQKKRKPNTVSCEELVSELENNLWELQATADSLNISRTSIYELMRLYNLKSASDLLEDEINESYIRCDKDIDKMITDLKVSKYALKRRMKQLNL